MPSASEKAEKAKWSESGPEIVPMGPKSRLLDFKGIGIQKYLR